MSAANRPACFDLQLAGTRKWTSNIYTSYYDPFASLSWSLLVKFCLSFVEFPLERISFKRIYEILKLVLQITSMLRTSFFEFWVSVESTLSQRVDDNSFEIPLCKCNDILRRDCFNILYSYLCSSGYTLFIDFWEICVFVQLLKRSLIGKLNVFIFTIFTIKLETIENCEIVQLCVCNKVLYWSGTVLRSFIEIAIVENIKWILAGFIKTSVTMSTTLSLNQT